MVSKTVKRGGVDAFVPKAPGVMGTLFPKKWAKGQESEFNKGEKARMDQVVKLDDCRSLLKKYGIEGTDAEISKGYKRFALKNHPDKGGDPEVFKEVQNCYDKLIKNKENGGRRRTRRRKSHRRR